MPKKPHKPAKPAPKRPAPAPPAPKVSPKPEQKPEPKPDPKPDPKPQPNLSPPVAHPPTPMPVAVPPASHPVSTEPPLRPIASTGPGKASSSAGPKSGVVIIGSLNMDLVVRTETMPLPGQTVMGQDLLQSPGGKGANQATAAGRLWHKRTPGAKLVGRIGDDLFGQNILAALAKSKVDASSVAATKNMPTGTAMIMVDRHGENAIVVAGGANRELSASDMLAQRKAIESSVVMVAQLEIPADTVACALALAKRSNVLTILDPAPAPPEGLPESLYHVDILTPNQSETELLTGVSLRTVHDARRAAERFLLRGTRIVIFKMGSQGAVIVHREGQEPGRGGEPHVQHVPGFRVQVKDATAAGDAFTGALAVALAEGMPLSQAVRFANAAGALTCTKPGAMSAIPNRAEVDALLSGV